jgi:hypothetical protein
VNYRYVAVDESGDLGFSEKASNFFVLSVFLYDDTFLSRKIRKFIQKLNHTKNNKKITLLHARNDSDKIKLKMVKFLNGLEYKSIVLVCDKSKYLDKNLYVDMVQYVIGVIDIYHTEEVFVTLPSNNKNFESEVKKISKKIIITTPANINVLQLPDFIAWCVYKKFEHKDDIFYSLIKDKINLRIFP